MENLEESDFRPNPMTWLKSLQKNIKLYSETHDKKYLSYALTAILEYERSLEKFDFCVSDAHRNTIVLIKINIYEHIITHLKSLLLPVQIKELLVPIQTNNIIDCSKRK